MASQIASLIFLCILSFLVLFCSPTSQSEYGNSSSGFYLELIPPYSPKSPFHSEYLSIMRSNGQYSLHQTGMAANSVGRITLSRIVVKVGIGTFKRRASGTTYKSYFLVMDTGSSIIWTQCEGCKKPGNKCYPQKEPPFPNTESSSYKAGVIVEGSNNYQVGYVDHSGSKGTYGKDIFYFPAVIDSYQPSKVPSVKDVTFGCGIVNAEPAATSNKYMIAGVFGLGRRSMSFVNQQKQLTGGKFSYCLLSQQQLNTDPDELEKLPPMYLWFGDAIKPPANPVQKTSLNKQDLDFYSVELLDIGVNGVKLGIDAVKVKDSGGLIVDSGFSTSVILKGAYEKLENGILRHFQGHPEFNRYSRIVAGLNVSCYSRSGTSGGFTNLPTVNFYFRGAQLDISPTGLFLRSVIAAKQEEFCFMVTPSETYTILGAFQQVNHKFVFTQTELQFGPEEDCASSNRV